MMLHEITENNNYYAVKFYSVVTVLIAAAVSSVCTMYQGRRPALHGLVRCAPGTWARPGSTLHSLQNVVLARGLHLYVQCTRTARIRVGGTGTLGSTTKCIRMESAKIAVYSQIILSSRTENEDKVIN